MMPHRIIAWFKGFDAFSVSTGVLGTAAVGLGGMLSDHGDLILAGGLGLIILAALETSLSRRFAQHERVESDAQAELIKTQRQAFLDTLNTIKDDLKNEMARLMNIFDGMAASFEYNTRNGKDLQREVQAVKEGLQNVREELTGLRTKVDSLEARWSRYV